MRKPNESLDDYVVKALPETTEPPLPVSLRFTGEVEVLKPLARWERPVKLVPAPVMTTPRGLSWFHRSLVMGGGLSIAALVLASAMIIGVSDSATPSETAQIEFVEVPNSIDRALPEEVPLSSDIFSTPESKTVDVAVSSRTLKQRFYRSHFPRIAARTKVSVRKAAVKPVKEPQQSLVSRFIPTTLVIYIENGLIRTRIEPWLTDRK